MKRALSLNQLVEECRELETDQKERYANEGRRADKFGVVGAVPYGAMAGMAVGGLLNGKKGVTKKAALLGAGTALGSRLMKSKSIKQDRDEAQTKEGQAARAAFLRANKKNSMAVGMSSLVALGGIYGRRPLNAVAAKVGKVVRQTTKKAKAVNRLMRMKKGGDSGLKGVTRTRGVPKGKGPILDAETGERYPALTSRRANLSEVAAECRELKVAMGEQVYEGVGNRYVMRKDGVLDEVAKTNPLAWVANKVSNHKTSRARAWARAQAARVNNELQRKVYHEDDPEKFIGMVERQANKVKPSWEKKAQLAELAAECRELGRGDQVTKMIKRMGPLARKIDPIEKSILKRGRLAKKTYSKEGIDQIRNAYASRVKQARQGVLEMSDLAAECRELRLRDEQGEFVPSSAGAADPRLHAAAYELPGQKKVKKRGAAGAWERLLLRKGSFQGS